MLTASWAQKLRLVSNPDWFPDTPEGWPDATAFLNGCFQAKRNLESFDKDIQTLEDHWKSHFHSLSQRKPQDET